MKLDSDDKNGTDYVRNKFVPKAEEIFAGLPRPKDWHTQEEIAGAVEVPRQTITDWTDDFAEKLAADKSAKCIPHARGGLRFRNFGKPNL